MRLSLVFIMFGVLVNDSAIAGTPTCQPAGQVSEVVRQAQEILDQVTCRELNIGERRVFNLNNDDSPTTMEHRYALTKKSGRHYELSFNLDFQVVDPEKPELAQVMRDRVTTCIHEINSRLTGADGTRVTFRLVDPSTDDTDLQSIKTKIEVTDEVIREHSHSYSTQSSCGAITHELLHLAGLADEYSAHADTPFSYKSCRVTGPADSIMRDSYGVQVANQFSGTICECQTGTACNNYSYAETSHLTSCPEGYSPKQDIIVTSAKEVDYTMFASHFGGGMGPRLDVKRLPLVSTYERGLNPVTLYPAQLRSILYPYCYSKNSLYYGCTKGSRLFAPRFSYLRCPETPDECLDPDLWLQ